MTLGVADEVLDIDCVLDGVMVAVTLGEVVRLAVAVPVLVPVLDPVLVLVAVAVAVLVLDGVTVDELVDVVLTRVAVALALVVPGGHRYSGAHGEQVADPGPAKVPPGHRVGAPQATPHAKPAGHSKQGTLPVPPGLNRPALQTNCTERGGRAWMGADFQCFRAKRCQYLM